MTDTPRLTTDEALAIVFAYQKTWPHALPPLHRKVYNAAVLHLHTVGTNAMVREVDAMKPDAGKPVRSNIKTQDVRQHMLDLLAKKRAPDTLAYALKDSPMAKVEMGALIDELNDVYGRVMPGRACGGYVRSNVARETCEQYKKQDGRWACFKCDVSYDHKFECRSPQVKANRPANQVDAIDPYCVQRRHTGETDMWTCPYCCVAYAYPFACERAKGRD